MGIAAEEPRSVADLLVQIESLPWFRNIGKPTPGGPGAQRIYTWEDWPGPEEPSVFELAHRQQALYDEIMRAVGHHREQLLALWERIHAAVFRLAAAEVPYDPQQDAWHAPTAAVWQAAWTAGLVGLCLQSGRPIPPELQEQWRWFVRGHWPAGFASVRGGDQLGPLLVY
jgi:hypothetical protein